MEAAPEGAVFFAFGCARFYKFFKIHLQKARKQGRIKLTLFPILFYNKTIVHELVHKMRG